MRKMRLATHKRRAMGAETVLAKRVLYRKSKMKARDYLLRRTKVEFPRAITEQFFDVQESAEVPPVLNHR